MLPLLAATVYTITMCVGILAHTTTIRFGRVHHILFFLCCVTTIAALLFPLNWKCTLPAIILFCMPFTKKGSTWHILLASIGFLFWLQIIF